MKNRKSILLVVLLLAVGFAAVSTTLYINGSTNINPNQDDFDVYYSDAYVNGEKDLSVITSDTVIEFTTTFEKINQKYTLEYEVTNASKNYDAELEMFCTGGNEYLTVTNEFDTNTILEARKSRLGTLIIEQTKSYVGEDLEVTIECTIDANAIERTSLNTEDLDLAGTYVIEGTYMNSGNSKLANKNLIIFSDTPHYVKTDANGYLFYDGLERGSHEIYYVEDTLDNIKTMTKEEIIQNAQASATFTTGTKDSIIFDNNSSISSLNITLSAKYCGEFIDDEWTFSYTGKEQSFSTKCAGTYKIELWGASGGGSGGLAGYTAGNIKLLSNDTLYVYVGSRGSVGSVGGSGAGYNGGGYAQIYQATSPSRFGGGGATDIRLINGNWNNSTGLKSRIMVAGGAGGYSENDSSESPNMCGGGLTGYHGGLYSAGGGGTQTAGGSNYSSSSFGTSGKGAFGIGGFGNSHAGGGGGGYYGGGGGARDIKDGNGGGGSSFISGHSGCDAIDESGSHTGQANHYSGYVFTDTIMVDGAGYNWTTSKGEYTGMPSHDGTTIMTGNYGNGYAKITYLGTN